MVRAKLREKAKLRDRCAVLVEVARKLGTIYDLSTTNATQRHYIETIIGAALWYLPTSKELWTGAISVRALKDHDPDSGVSKPRLTEDHARPRKVSAKELVQRAWEDTDPGGAMLQLYLERYGRYNYITPTENKVLVKFQKTDVFAEPAVAYGKAEIVLVCITLPELKCVRRRDKQTIEALVERGSAEPVGPPDLVT